MPPPRRPRAAATAAPTGGTTSPPGAHLAPGDGTGAGAGRRGGLIVAVVVAVVALLAVGAVMVVGGNDGDDPAASDDTTEDRSGSTETVDILTEPVDVTRAFFAALGEGDCAQMMSLLTEGSLFAAEQTAEQTLATCEASVDDGSVGFTGMAAGDVRLESMAGDVATVAVDLTLDGQASTEHLRLQLVDGQWKLDLPGST